MARKSPIREALKAKVKPTRRSGSEDKVEAQLVAAGIKFTYEAKKIPVVIPERTATYLQDYQPDGTNIILEVKGHFGGLGLDIKRRSAEVRYKMVLLKEQHPELDIRFVFDRASTPIYPRSPTSHGKWATDHGFKWADKGTIPPAWIIEMQQQQKGRKT